MDSFYKYFSIFTSIPNQEWKEFESICIEKKLKKNTVYIAEDSPVLHEVFIKNGILRSYCLHEKGEEITTAFYTDSTVLPPLFTRNIKGYSTSYFQALEDSTIIEFNAIIFSELIKKYSWVKEFANKIVEKELLFLTKRQKYMISGTAKEKYKYFTQEYPKIETRISQIYVASFLGINPVSLSRLKNEKS